MLQTNIEQTTPTQGVGAYLLDSPTNPLRISFVQGVGSGAKVWYRCETLEGTTPVQWEEGWGVVTAGDTDVLTRQGVTRSSNNNGFVSWGFGTKRIGCIEPAEQSLFGGPGSVPIATNTANALRIEHFPPMRVVQPGMTVAFIASQINTGNMTLAVDGLAEAPFKTNQNMEIPAGAIQVGDLVLAKRVGGTWYWINSAMNGRVFNRSPVFVNSPTFVGFPLPANSNVSKFTFSNLFPTVDATFFFAVSMDNGNTNIVSNTYINSYYSTLGVGAPFLSTFGILSHFLKSGYISFTGHAVIGYGANEVTWTCTAVAGSTVSGNPTLQSATFSGVLSTPARVNRIGFGFAGANFVNSGIIEQEILVR